MSMEPEAVSDHVRQRVLASAALAADDGDDLPMVEWTS